LIIGIHDPSRCELQTLSFSATVIAHAVWLYVRLPLSLRLVEDIAGLTAVGESTLHATLLSDAIADPSVPAAASVPKRATHSSPSTGQPDLR
jgi:transposase-like protein